jgi:HD-GYP domain-containing protein (c-di-GMP phosphodiesterase class II)
MANKKHNKIININNLNKNCLFELLNEIALVKYKQIKDIIEVIVLLINEKDKYTKEHSVRVSKYSYLLGLELNLSENDLISLQLAALLHDLGKIGVSDRVLKKPGKLSCIEFEEMKEHSNKANKIISNIDCLKHLAPFIKYHHERYDGKGYPNNLKGEEIPLFSRIILIADTVDAMMSTRPYRKGLNLKQVIDELKLCSGTQFDPNLVKLFIKAIYKSENLKKVV